MVQESYGVNAFRAFIIFPPISYKNCFFSKIPITNRNFFAFPESSLYVGNFRHKRGAVKKCLIIFSQPFSTSVINSENYQK